MTLARNYNQVAAIGLAATFALSLAVGAAAQPSQVGTGAQPGLQAGTGQMGPRGLGLTPEQETKIKAMREQQQPEAQALRDRLTTARQKLRDIQTAQTLDEKTLREAAVAAANLQADAAVMRARHRSQFLSLLTPEQRTKAEQRFARAGQARQHMAMRTRQDGRQGRGSRMGANRRGRMMCPCMEQGQGPMGRGARGDRGFDPWWY
jgi:Spy/CpxP family protein refolding chaperone